MIVVADTTPINYLVLIGEQELLPALFGQVIIPEAVRRECLAVDTPRDVRQWMADPPGWLEIRGAVMNPDATLAHLDAGEREAIQLAEACKADLLLVDEKAARREAAKRHLATSGTLGILDRAAEKRLVDFSLAFGRLKQTSFYMSSTVEQFFVEGERRRIASRKMS